MRKTITDYEFGDSREHIDMCLNCTRPQCVNCFGSLRRVTDTVRSPVENLNIDYSIPLSWEEERLVEMYPTASGDRDIAEVIGYSVSQIGKMRKRLGLPQLRKLTQREREEIVKPWLEK